MTSPAPQTRALRPADIYRLPLPSDPQLSPDGRTVVFAQRRAEADTDDYVCSLWRTDAVGLRSDPHRLTDGEQDDHPALSPDGRTVAFLRREGDRRQLCSVPVEGAVEGAVDGGVVTVLTKKSALPFGAGAPVWSPDGRALAFVAAVRRDGAAPGPDDALAPVVADRLAFKSDGAGRYRELVHHVHLLDLDSGRVRQLTRGDWHAGPPAFSPDGGRIAFTAAAEPDADLEMTSAAYLVDVDVAEPVTAPRRIGRSRFVSGPLVWLPDASAVLAIGRPDWRIGNKHLYALAVDADVPDRDLTATLDRNLLPGSAAYPGAAPALTAAGDVLFCVRDQGWTHLYRVGPTAAEPRPEPVLARPHLSVTGLSARAGSDRIAVVLSDQQRFGEIAVLGVDDHDQPDPTPDVRTELTAAALPDVELITGELRTFVVGDGSQVSGWLFSPTEAAGRTPLLLDVHGGPHNAWTGLADQTHVYQQQLVEQGWRILIVNPRGSDGYGEAFMRGVVGAWGVADEDDFLAPIGQLITEGLVDPERVAITGYSYGGFTTCRLTAVTDVFAAAVAGGVVCDLTAQVGASDLGLELTRAFSAADPITEQSRLADLSPIRRIGDVDTPTLVLHGEDDHRCPVNQAERWFGLLRLQQVPTRLVVYPGGSHSFVIDGRPSHRVDYNQRVVDWLTRYTMLLSDRGGER